MLFKRYGDPISLLRTYRLCDLMEFIFYVQELEQEEKIYNQWLHTQMTQSLQEFKDQQKYRPLRKNKAKSTTKEEQQKALDFASQFVKPRKEGEVS